MRLSRLFCIVILALASPVAATEYFVSPTGSNSNACTAGGASACATINGAIGKASADLNACGDTVTIQGGTYSGNVDIPNMNCTTSRFILRGDPAAATSAVVVAGKITVGVSNSTSRRGYTIQHMKFAATSLPMFDVTCSGSSSTEIRDVTLDDILITSIPAPTSHAPNNAVAKYALGLHKGDACSGAMANFVFKNLNISNGGTRARVNLIFGFSGFTLQDSVIADQSGHIFYGSSRTNITITRNTFSNALCTCVVDTCSGDIEADGDGCIIGYNNSNMVVTYNVFASVSGNDGSNGVSGVMNLRRTTSSTTPAASAVFQHNTLISGQPTNSGAFNDAFWVDSAASAVVRDNIFIQYGSSETRSAAIRWWGCPTSKTEDHNLFYQNAGNRDIFDNTGGGCGGNNGYGAGDVHGGLNPFAGCTTPATCPGGPYIPPSTSAACGAASDGTAIGAKNCVAASGTPPPNVQGLRRTDKH